MSSDEKPKAMMNPNLNQVLNDPAPTFEEGGSINATCIIDCHNILGEGILYDDEKNEIIWTDIMGKQFNILKLDTGEHIVKSLPKMLGAFALRPKEERGYLFAWEDGFQLYDVEEGKELSEMSHGEDVNPLKLPQRLNDGRTDPTGKFFVCGGYFGGVQGNFTKVFKCSFSDLEGSELNLVHEAIVDKIRITNSICWSVDGKSMFLADSLEKAIQKHEYDQESGKLSKKQILRNVKIGVPDGSTVDSKGNLWNAVFRAGAGPAMVQCINTLTGEAIYTVNMPDSTSQVTCCCFGGPNLNIMFITTASENVDLDKEPNAGCIYAVKLGIKGCLEKRFTGRK